MAPKSKKENKSEQTALSKISTLIPSLSTLDAAKAKQDNNLERLTTILNEYLGCYVVIGYAPNGDPITIVKAKNAQEADSLGTSIHRFLQNQRGAL